MNSKLREPTGGDKADEGTARRVPLACSFMALLWLLFGQSSARADEGPPPPPEAVSRTENYIGVFTAPLPEDRRAQFAELLGGDEGLVVLHVLPGSPAARAGIERDDVLADYDGKPIASGDQLKSLIDETDPGRSVSLRIVHSGERKTVSLAVAERELPAGTGDESRLSEPAGRILSSLVAQGRRREGTARGDGERLPAAPPLPVARHADDPSSPAPFIDRAVRIVTADGKTFQVDLVSADIEGNQDAQQFEGTAAEIAALTHDLSAEVREEISRTVEEAALQRQQKPAVRFRLQPGLPGTDSHLRVRLTHPGREGETRLFALEQSLHPDRPADIDRLLKHEQLAAELRQLSPPVRDQVEKTLRQVRIPEVRVQVRNSQ